MAARIEVLFTPVEFRQLRNRDLSQTTCVVFDVLRATTSIVAALGAGAAGVVAVSEIAEALAWRERRPDTLLAGERKGLRIGAALTGGVDFDLGNSPREYTRAVVARKLIVMTTTNGTRAMQACEGAAGLMAGSFLNLVATAEFIVKRNPEQLCLVCAGTGETAALEDTLAAGALCEALRLLKFESESDDSALIARRAFLHGGENLADAIGQARNARRLLRLPELCDDVEFCLRRDALGLVAVSDAEGILRRVD